MLSNHIFTLFCTLVIFTLVQYLDLVGCVINLPVKDAKTTELNSSSPTFFLKLNTIPFVIKLESMADKQRLCARFARNCTECVQQDRCFYCENSRECVHQSQLEQTQRTLSCKATSNCDHISVQKMFYFLVAGFFGFNVIILILVYLRRRRHARTEVKHLLLPKPNNRRMVV